MNHLHQVFIIDDQTLAREGVRALLERDERFAFAGESSTCEEGRDGVATIPTDLVLIDPAIEDGSGVQCIRSLCAEHDDLAILALTMAQDLEAVYEVICAGANGYLLKDACPEEMSLAMRSVLEGKTYLSPGVCRDVLRECIDGLKHRQTNDALKGLTRREREVFHLVGQGRKNREVAELLYISVKTVEKHRASLMNKLALASARELHALWRTVRRT